MSGNANDSLVPRRRVDDVIATYLDAVDRGEAPKPSDLIAEHPDIANDLKSFFADWMHFERLARGLNSGGAGEQAPEDVVLNAGDSGTISDRLTRGSNGTPIRSFGDYELLEEIARGGMGVVYRARQISLNRIVALKMILAGHWASQEDLQRFHAEAEAAANLDHPGIVPIYEVGQHGGQHYFSMGYVEGCSLATQLREGPLSARPAASLLKQVCAAIQFAHEHDVIHRDLKPANILLERRPDPMRSSQQQAESDALPSDFKPRVTDFGLAKRLKGNCDLTGTGQILGTPGYMSPEQASGTTPAVAPPTDVYSLGAILYELLTGRPPFQAETPLETLSQLLESDPLPPRLLNRNVPRDLEAVCMKCLEKEPQRRYPSARDLGRDLDRFLEGEAVRASGINLLDRMTRALRHSRHEEHFRGWGLGLIAFGLVILLSHVAIFVLERSWSDRWATYLLPRSVMFAALLIMLWRFRHHSVLPTKSPERLIWVVWSGYLLSLAAANAVRAALGREHGETYAFSAVLTGFGFLIMGGHTWGGGYVVGLVFMIAAPILALHAEFAPLTFGVLWAAALGTFGIHYWRRGPVGGASDSAIHSKS